MQVTRLHNNFRTAILTTFVVIASILVWMVAPSVYVSVTDLLPEQLRAQTAGNQAELYHRIGHLETRLHGVRADDRIRSLTGGTSSGARTNLPAASTLASVLARPPATPYDTLLVDAGRADGIQSGAAVWWPPGIYLGEVVDVRDQHAVVRLISSSRVRHTVRIDNRLTTTVSGHGGGSMIASIPAESDITTNTTAVSDRYNAPIGRVVTARSSEAAGRRLLFIRPIIPASVIEYVSIEQQ